MREKLDVLVKHLHAKACNVSIQQTVGDTGGGATTTYLLEINYKCA